jgi:hypothetical protein
MPDRRAPLVLIAGLTLASPSLLNDVAHRLMLCVPDTWAPAIVVGISLGLIAFVTVAACRAHLRRRLVLAMRPSPKGLPATDA